MNVGSLAVARLRALVLALPLLGIGAFGASSVSAAPLFPQCPPVGNNHGCSQLIVVNGDGSVGVKVDPAAPASGYDGADDTLVGLQNNSRKAVASINLASPNSIFGFETGTAQDGLCNTAQWPAAPALPAPGCAQVGPQGFGPTGYEGPNNTFSNISLNSETGTVNFKTPVASGSHAYWALEEALRAGQLLSGSAGHPITTAPKVFNVSVTFSLVCVGANPCNGSAQLVVTLHQRANGAFVARLRTRQVVVGSVRVSVAPGGTAPVKVSLNKRGRKLLSTVRSLRAVVRVNLKQANGLGVVTRVGTVKFRGHRR